MIGVVLGIVDDWMNDHTSVSVVESPINGFLIITLPPLLQKTIAKLDSNIGQLEEKLKYERQKFVSYNKDLEDAKSKCVPSPPCHPPPLLLGAYVLMPAGMLPIQIHTDVCGGQCPSPNHSQSPCFERHRIKPIVCGHAIYFLLFLSLLCTLFAAHVGVVSDRWNDRRFKASDAERAAIQAQCDNAEEELKEFERRDIKHKEDRKHCKAKLKKAEEKLAKDASKLQVLPPPP